MTIENGTYKIERKSGTQKYIHITNATLVNGILKFIHYPYNKEKKMTGVAKMTPLIID